MNSVSPIGKDKDISLSNDKFEIKFLKQIYSKYQHFTSKHYYFKQ